MEILKATIREFLDDECTRMAAALSYYTMFSLPGLLILVMLVLGMFMEPEDIQGRILVQMRALIGPAAADQVREILRHASSPGAGSPLVVGLSLGALLFAATGAFAQLQVTLNRAWDVAPDPERGEIRNFLAKRLLSFIMIMGIALVLFASSLSNAVLAAFGDLVQAVLPAALSGAAIWIINLVLSLLTATLLFGVIFHVVPDARVHWKDAWRGAATTAFLFILGNFLLGLYFSRSSPASAFGAAGSLALIMVWVYYSSMIFFVGAELTQVLARRRGEGIRPSPGAVRVIMDRRTIREGQ